MCMGGGHKSVSRRDKAQFHFPAEGGGGFAEAGHGERWIRWIQQTIQRGAAGFHAGGELGLGDVFRLEDLLELNGDSALQREYFHCRKESFFSEKIAEVASAVGVLGGFCFHGLDRII